MSCSITTANSSSSSLIHRKPISQNLILFPFSISFPLYKTRLSAIKTGSDGVRSGNETTSSYGSDLLRKPIVSTPINDDETGKEYSCDNDEDDESGDKKKKKKKKKRDGGDGDTWVDWEDQILEDTVPLVGFVRMILHSGKYESGDRLSAEHEKTIMERLLPHHPECDKKIGCGVDYITIGYHPNFDTSRCLFIVRKDGELVDFSYWKCIKGLIRTNYPLYADSFILRHFRKNRRSY